MSSPALGQPSTAPQGPDRSGFTANLSIGLGITNVAPDEGDSETKVGLAGLNVDLGAYITPQLAILFRITGTQFSVDVGTDSEEFVNAFAGVAGQYWVNEQLAIEGGAGVAIFGPNFASDLNIDSKSGFAINARGTYRFSGGWQGSLELMPAFYNGFTVMSSSLLVGYQWD